MAVLLAGCARQDQGEEGKVVSATLRALIAGGKSKICVDSRTHGEPLAIFRTMALAPDPARRPLVWRLPTPVESGQRLSGRDLVNSQFSGLHPVLAEPDPAVAPLAPIDQFTLNALARQLSRIRETRNISLSGAKTSGPVRVRWWGFNRLDPSCSRLVTVSNPVVLRDTAFVSVTSGHWGTTYALRQKGGAWQPAAQWADWLY